MKFRNQFLKFKLNCQAAPDGGDGGGGNAGGGDNQGGNDGGDNNADPNLISHDTLWDTTASDNGNGNDNQGGQQANAGQQPQQPNANEAFNTHIAGLNFLEGVDSASVLSAIQGGDAEALSKAFTQVGINSYRNTMLDANKVIQQRMDKMGTNIKQEVNASQATGVVIQAMNEALPFTKNAAFAPIAKLTLTQFMEKGVPPDKAIQEVGKYFKNLSGEVSKLSPEASNLGPSGGFGGHYQQGNPDGNEGGEPDWVKILGGAPQT